MKKLSFILNCIFLLFALSSCRHEEDHIRRFDIIGTGPQLDSEIAAINPAINDGRFEITAKIEKESTKKITVLLSETPDWNQSFDQLYSFESDDRCYNGTSDVFFFPGLYERCKGLPFSIQCKFSNDNTIACARGDSPLKVVNITEFLDTLPKNAYILLESCRETNDCEHKARPVQFQ